MNSAATAPPEATPATAEALDTVPLLETPVAATAPEPAATAHVAMSAGPEPSTPDVRGAAPGDLEGLRRENASFRARVTALEEALADSAQRIRTLEAKLEAVLTVPQPEDTTKPRVYRVRTGDTLYTIAERPEIYNDGRLWPRILEANRHVLPDESKLQPGQQLVIPR